MQSACRSRMRTTQNPSHSSAQQCTATHICTPSAREGGRRLSGAYWPNSPAESARFMCSEKPCLKKYLDLWPPLQCMCICTLTHTHARARVHAHRHTQTQTNTPCGTSNSDSALSPRAEAATPPMWEAHARGHGTTWPGQLSELPASTVHTRRLP